jgi:hypothetical protein
VMLSMVALFPDRQLVLLCYKFGSSLQI